MSSFAPACLAVKRSSIHATPLARESFSAATAAARALQLRCRDAPRPARPISFFFYFPRRRRAFGDRQRQAARRRCSVLLQHCRRSIKRQRVEPHPAGADGWPAPRGQRYTSYLRRARRCRRRLPIGRHHRHRHTSFIHRHLCTGTRLRSAARCAAPTTGLHIGGAVAFGPFITITHPSIGPSARVSLPLLEPA